jgi:hypothetical protein
MQILYSSDEIFRQVYWSSTHGIQKYSHPASMDYCVSRTARFFPTVNDLHNIATFSWPAAHTIQQILAHDVPDAACESAARIRMVTLSSAPADNLPLPKSIYTPHEQAGGHCGLLWAIDRWANNPPYEGW